MKKVSGYVGLIVAALFAFVFLYPQKDNFLNPRVNITPLDSTGLSIIVQASSDSHQLLMRLERYVRRCTRSPQSRLSTDCDALQVRPSLMEMANFQHFIEIYSKGFSEQLRQYIDNNSGDEVLMELQDKAVATYPSVIPILTKSYVTAVWISHVVFLAFIFALIYFRHPVGRFLISMVLMPLGLVFKGAKKFHERV